MVSDCEGYEVLLGTPLCHLILQSPFRVLTAAAITSLLSEWGQEYITHHIALSAGFLKRIHPHRRTMPELVGDWELRKKLGQMNGSGRCVITSESMVGSFAPHYILLYSLKRTIPNPKRTAFFTLLKYLFGPAKANIIRKYI